MIAGWPAGAVSPAFETTGTAGGAPNGVGGGEVWVEAIRGPVSKSVTEVSDAAVETAAATAMAEAARACSLLQPRIKSTASKTVVPATATKTPFKKRSRRRCR